MNIVYGGSFNPPTIAHYQIMHEILNKFKPERIIIMPVGNNYSHKKNLEDIKHRFAMLSLMIDDKRIVLDDTEASLKEYKGTYYTMRILEKKYSDLYFVMGADNLINISKWIEYEKLIKNYNFVVLTRGEIDVYEKIEKYSVGYKEHFHVLNIDIPISSSLIKENIEAHKNMLHPRVYEYIEQNKLYRK